MEDPASKVQAFNPLPGYFDTIIINIAGSMPEPDEYLDKNSLRFGSYSIRFDRKPE